MRATWYGVATALEAPRDIHWSKRARCAQPDVDPDWWYSDDRAVRATALHICLEHCPVLAQCQADALARPPEEKIALARYGAVQGGLLWTRKPEPEPPLVAPFCVLCADMPKPGCGTARGARWHRKHGERVCPWCAEAEQRRRAKREKKAERTGRHPEGSLRPCGTTAAFRRHKARGEWPCQMCIEAEENRR